MRTNLEPSLETPRAATAAAVRASIERGESIIYRTGFAMFPSFGASHGVSPAIRAPLAATTDEPVADDTHGPDLPLGNVPAEPDRLDGAAVEHKGSVESAREMCKRGARWSEIVAAHPSPPWQGDVTVEPDGAAMEHERQSRRSRWQCLP